MFRWLPEVFYRPDIYEKYGDTFDTPKYKEKDAENERVKVQKESKQVLILYLMRNMLVVHQV